MPPAYIKAPTEGTLAIYVKANPFCTGKVRFESAVIARRAALRKKNREVYRCPACGGFHVSSGGIPEPSRAKLVKPLVVKEVR
jgi:hypothetical protein